MGCSEPGPETGTRKAAVVRLAVRRSVYFCATGLEVTGSMGIHILAGMVSLS